MNNGARVAVNIWISIWLIINSFLLASNFKSFFDFSISFLAGEKIAKLDTFNIQSIGLLMGVVLGLALLLINNNDFLKKTEVNLQRIAIAQTLACLYYIYSPVLMLFQWNVVIVIIAWIFYSPSIVFFTLHLQWLQSLRSEILKEEVANNKLDSSEPFYRKLAEPIFSILLALAFIVVIAIGSFTLNSNCQDNNSCFSGKDSANNCDENCQNEAEKNWLEKNKLYLSKDKNNPTVFNISKGEKSTKEQVLDNSGLIYTVLYPLNWNNYSSCSSTSRFYTTDVYEQGQTQISFKNEINLKKYTTSNWSDPIFQGECTGNVSIAKSDLYFQNNFLDSCQEKPITLNAYNKFDTAEILDYNCGDKQTQLLNSGSGWVKTDILSSLKKDIAKYKANGFVLNKDQLKLSESPDIAQKEYEFYSVIRRLSRFGDSVSQINFYGQDYSQYLSKLGDSVSQNNSSESRKSIPAMLNIQNIEMTENQITITAKYNEKNGKVGEIYIPKYFFTKNQGQWALDLQQSLNSVQNNTAYYYKVGEAIIDIEKKQIVEDKNNVVDAVLQRGIYNKNSIQKAQASSKVHLVDVQSFNGNSPITVKITDTKNPIILILNAGYDGKWIIQKENGVNLTQVILAGNNSQGKPQGVEDKNLVILDRNNDDSSRTLGSSVTSNVLPVQTNPELKNIKSNIQKLVGKEPNSVQAFENIGSFPLVLIEEQTSGDKIYKQNQEPEYAGKIQDYTGDIVSRNHDLNLPDNIVITGNVEVSGGNLNIGKNVKITGDVKVQSGSMTVQDSVQISGKVLVLSGNLRVFNQVKIQGDIGSSSGDIIIGSNGEFGNIIKAYKVVAGDENKFKNISASDVILGQNNTTGEIKAYTVKKGGV